MFTLLVRVLARLFLIGVLSLSVARLAADETKYVWPDASPAELREEIFGIRFRLVLWDRGPEKAARFLRDEIRERPQAPEVLAYMAWASLFPDSWKMGELVPRDQCEAVLSAAADAGSWVARDVLAYGKINGRVGIAEDLETGLRLLRESAAAGFPRSIGRLGRMQVEGWYVPAKREEGMKNLERALILGSTTDLADLAEAYERRAGHGARLEQQPALALDYYYRLALENDDTGWNKLKELAEKNVPRAQMMLAVARVRFANEGGFVMPARVKPYVEMLEASTAQDVLACVELGIAKLEGRYAKRDLEKAKELFAQARQAGNEDAAFFLAYMRMRGWAGPQEKDAALQEMKALAAAGNARANGRLGYFYYWGASDAGVLKKDPQLAFQYVRRAAELGSRWAALNLAHCYRHGIGTAENQVLAAKMYFMAYKCGFYGAKEELRRHLAFIK